MIAAGVNAKALSSYMGHSSITHYEIAVDDLFDACLAAMNAAMPGAQETEGS
jgi:hypothetical protein